MQPIWNPAQSLVQGLTVAQRLRDSLQRQQMEERQMKLAEEEQARAREVRNIQMLGEIVRGARGVAPDGTVNGAPAAQETIDTRMEGLPNAMQPKPVTATSVANRAADPSRTFDFQGRRFEFMNPDELNARQLEQARLAGEQQNAQALERFKGQAAVTDAYHQKDRDLQEKLATGRITAQQAIAEARARAEQDQEAKRQQFQRELEGMRQGFQAGQNDLNRQTTLTAASIRKASSGAAGSNDQALIDAVSQNPALLDSLTPTVKSRIIPALSAAGVKIPGKDAAAGDIRKFGELQSALEGVGQLKQAMEAGSSYVGPVAGYQTINPWSKGREVQANIDLILQKVGRALEGGVLRKEDEEKYKRILPTIHDTMETAKAKIAMLEQELSRDMSTLKQANQGVGRETPSMGGGAPAASGGTVRLQAPDGSVSDVPAAMADHYLKLGARRVR